MLKLICLVFVLGILISSLHLGRMKSTGSIHDDNSLVRVKRVVGGQIAYKHLDSVFAYSNEGKHCTGTFIAPNMILTAADCCYSFAAPSPIKIYNAKRTIEATISAVHINPIYVTGGFKAEEDIAVIKLDRNVDSITVASLGFNYAISCDETVYGYGFGHTDPFKYAMSDKLKVFTAKVIQCTWSTYYKHYIPFVHFKDPLLTVGVDGISSHGDNGGPLITKDDLLIGVLSHYSIVIDRKAAIYARISKHKKFLQTILS